MQTPTSGFDAESTSDAFLAKWRRFRNAHWPRYVFIHINKTAGSSIERALDLRFEHKTAIEKRFELGDLRWNRAIKFTFVRNPWDKVFSHYKFRVQTNQTSLGQSPIPFPEWVIRAYGAREPQLYDQPRMFMPQMSWITDDHGEVLVDYIGRFESLKTDFLQLCRMIGVNSRLPHLKPSTSQSYRTAYNQEAKLCIAEAFAADINQFRYDF